MHGSHYGIKYILTVSVMMTNNSKYHVDHYNHACGKPIREQELAVMTNQPRTSIG